MKTVLVILLTLIMAQVVKADCSKTLDLCNEAVNKQGKVIKDQDKVIADYAKETELDKQINTDLHKELSSPLRDPVKVAAGTTLLILIIEIATGHIK